MFTLKSYVFVIFILTIGFFLQGCALSSPFKGPGYSGGEPKKELITSNQKFILAVTNAKLIRSKSSGFNQKSKDIYSNIEENPGYVGGAVRFKLFSSEVWTLTVWKDRQSLNNFLDSKRHSDAMYTEYEAMSEFKHFNREISPHELPQNWDLVDQILSEMTYTKGRPL